MFTNTTKTKFRLKKGDMIVVIAGKDKGKQAKISKVIAGASRVVVDGVNMITRATKPSQANPQGGLVSKEGTIHISNVMLLDPKTNKPTRVGKKVVKGKITRFAKKSGTELN